MYTPSQKENWGISACDPQACLSGISLLLVSAAMFGYTEPSRPHLLSQSITYDEPTTGLDPITARVIHELMFSMQKELKVTSVVISHDVDIFKYADYVALLYDGQIKYFGDAKSIWESDNKFIYQFIRGLPEGPIQTEVAHFKDKF